MLSVPAHKLPRKVIIKVAKAEKLVSSQKEKKKKLNNKFRVVILGGKKKESSDLVEDSNGNPEWNFTSTIKLPRGKLDPIVLIVEDSDGHHKGQVVIPLVKIGPKPYTQTLDQSPATSSSLICAELEPTNKCAVSAGFLIYWIWVDEYCADGDSDSRKSFTKSVTSLFGSKSTLPRPAGSIGNISSNSSLNKPEKHRHALDLFHKKGRTRKPSVDNHMGTNFYEVDPSTEFGTPFEPSKFGQNNRKVSCESRDLQLSSNGYPFTIGEDRVGFGKSYNPLPDRLDILSHGSHGSISESGSSSRYGDAMEYNSITPIILPPVSPESAGTVRQGNSVITSTVIGSPYRDTDQRHHPTNMSLSSSDFSIFSDRNINQPISITMKGLNDEADSLRRENTELRSQNNIINVKVSQLQNELDFVKDTLFKLRTRLLEEGATKFLEKV